jgi:hypothetical protein
MTAAILGVVDRRSDAFKTMRQGLAYCWSVAVATLSAAGQSLLEKRLTSDDRDVRWIMSKT